MYEEKEVSLVLRFENVSESGSQNTIAFDTASKWFAA